MNGALRHRIMRLYQKRHPQTVQMFFVQPKDDGYCVIHDGKIIAETKTREQAGKTVDEIPMRSPRKKDVRLVFHDSEPYKDVIRYASRP